MSEIATRASQAVNPLTGEVLDLPSMSSGELAGVIDGIRTAHTMLGAFEVQISDALLERLDSNACWTAHEGEFTITAPSPSAGCVEYLPDALETALRELIGEGIINAGAAEKACERRLTLELAVPFSADHRAMARTVKEAAAITVADVEVRVLRSEARTKANASGIAALRKVPGTAEALDGASVKRDAGQRKVSVKVRST